MTYADLQRKLEEQPFKPFRIRLSNGSAIDVLQPGSTIVGQSSAVVPTSWQTDEQGRRIALDWKTIALAHIVEFVDLDVKPPRRKGA